MVRTRSIVAVAIVLAAATALSVATAASLRTIIGTDRADVLRGTAGADTILGRGGNDLLDGRGGNDRLVGGPGIDRIVCGRGRDVAVADPRDRLVRGCEVVRGRPTALQRELARARAATARFRDVAQARAAGYVVASPCVASLEGAEGIRSSGRVTSSTVSCASDWRADADQNLGTADDKPRLFGRPFDGPMAGHDPAMPIHYDLHVWLWKTNPRGMFVAFNPNASCPPGSHGQSNH